mmetsp:Transcript_18735/g.40390  ORF Transcript_18735/g.40390 Transcript_18735/m.40390 type:complete len:147 (-) Transcript_18735:189-629(-)
MDKVGELYNNAGLAYKRACVYDQAEELYHQALRLQMLHYSSLDDVPGEGTWEGLLIMYHTQSREACNADMMALEGALNALLNTIGLATPIQTSKNVLLPQYRRMSIARNALIIAARAETVSQFRKALLLCIDPKCPRLMIFSPAWE